MDETIVYRHRPRLIGGEIVATLAPDALEVATGSRQVRMPYSEIKRVRVSFQPSNMMAKRFVCEIWPRGGGRLRVGSSSARSLIDSTDHGPEFRAFVTALVRKVGGAGRGAQLEAGMAAWRWWPMTIITVAVLAVAFALGVRALFTGETVFALAVVGFGGVLGWQMGNLIARNRPRTFSPEAIPPQVLP